jgi:hypothetical protein
MIEVEEGHEGDLQQLLESASFKAGIVGQDNVAHFAEPMSAYEKLKQIQKEIGDQQLFKEIKDPTEWQREIRKEWDRDF